MKWVDYQCDQILQALLYCYFKSCVGRFSAFQQSKGVKRFEITKIIFLRKVLSPTARQGAIAPSRPNLSVGGPAIIDEQHFLSWAACQQ